MYVLAQSATIYVGSTMYLRRVAQYILHLNDVNNVGV